MNKKKETKPKDPGIKEIMAPESNLDAVILLLTEQQRNNNLLWQGLQLIGQAGIQGTKVNEVGVRAMFMPVEDKEELPNDLYVRQGSKFVKYKRSKNA